MNFVQYAVIGHKDGVLPVFSLFNCNFFHCFFFCSFLFWTFFNSYGRAENKYLKVPQIGERSHRVQNAAYTQVRCCMYCECGCDLGTQQHLNSAKKSTFLPKFFFPLLFFTLPKNVFVKHLCILKST